MTTRTETDFLACKSSGSVSALCLMPRDATQVIVLGHGAGAGMRHPFMEKIANLLAEHHIATVRYQFPYMEKGTRRPDLKPILLSTVRSAIEHARNMAKGLPLLAGGKSMGGRMTSLALAEGASSDVQGVIFLGFPLHPPGRPSKERAEHLQHLSIPTLFIQGTRDPLANLSLLTPLCTALGKLATLYIIDGADHSFHLPKRMGRSDDEVMREIAQEITRWSVQILG